MRSFPSLIRAFANRFGIEMVRKKECPRLSFMGLQEMGFRSVVDVGANAGQFARIAAAAFPQAKIYCFEPIPEAFSVLSKWTQKTDSSRFVLFNVALGDCEGELEFHLHDDHTESSSFLRTTSRNVELYKSFMEHQSAIP